MKFNIPEIGTKVMLAEDWVFPLHHEYRNDSLFEVLGILHQHDWRNEPNPAPHTITIPKGTVLKVDRIYIRKGKGMSDFSSVTFLMPGRKTTKRTETHLGRNIGGPADGTTFTWTANYPARGVRFWVKLADANAMLLEEGGE
jgi:hypothetical protein